MTENEAVELAKTIDDELEARVINDEITAHVINDEIDAHKINDELTQVAETFDALEAAGEGVDMPDPRLQKMQDMMANYLASQANHQPGKEHTLDGVVYSVCGEPHKGMFVRKDKRVITNPNMDNNSVRRKIKKNPNKYTINIF
ncbi:MAG: hypothetical protein JHC33_05690 [Ignisphaera sp.]|nr:hypothetical protein [Ignisphaera sp.]